MATEETFDAVIELFRTQGADAWYTHEPKDFLPAGTCCTHCGAPVEPGDHFCGECGHKLD